VDLAGSGHNHQFGHGVMEGHNGTPWSKSVLS
jgi:hypothetical protein